MQNKKHILIIDDEPEVTDLLKDFFEKNNFTTEIAADGNEALKSLKDALPDIVITDLLLPGEHGISVIKTIKEKYSVPVIIITGIYERDELQNVIDGYSVEAFFEKPLNLEALLEKVNSVLNARAL
jgi:DNA-binding response OmpR family regulator